MKTKKQKLPSKPRTIDEITGKPGGFKKFLKKQEREAKQSEARRQQQRIKAARKPAHAEVFEGYGVMKQSGNLLWLTQTSLPFVSSERKVAELLSNLSKTARVVKIRVEFKVI